MEYKIGMYEKAVPDGTSFTQLFSYAKRSGFDYVELSIDRTEERIVRVYSNKLQQEIMEASNLYHMPVLSICLSALSTYTLGHSDPEYAARGLDIAYHTIQFAYKFGVRIVQVPACDVPKGECSSDESQKKYYYNMKKVVEFAASYGVMIGLENMETEFMDSVSKCMELVKSINSPYLQLYPDAGNIMMASLLANTSIREDMIRGKGHYVAFHVKEARENKYGGLFYGEGVVKFDEIIPYAWELGARLYVLEYWYVGNADWQGDLIRAREFLESNLPKR